MSASLQDMADAMTTNGPIEVPEDILDVEIYEHEDDD